MRHRLCVALLCAALLLPLRFCAGEREYYTNLEYISLAVSGYERLTGEDIDESDISSRVTVDRALRKALKVDIIGISTASAANYTLTYADALEIALGLKLALRERLNDSAIAVVTDAQAVDELNSALRTLGCDYRLAAPAAPDALLTRAHLAQLLVTAYEACAAPINAPDALRFTDTDDDFARKAVAARLMLYYPSKMAFEPAATVTCETLYQHLVNSAAAHTDVRRPMPADLADRLLAETLLVFSGEAGEPPIRRVVNNDIDRDWYVNQLATGKYGVNNCMPACGEMLLDYFDADNSITTAQLRALSPHEGLGWYEIEFYNVMRSIGLPLGSEYAMDASTLCTHIDAGRLAVAMCSFDGGATGHAVVVYGYELSANGCRFMCHDPLSPGINKYGKPSGNARRIEAEELLRAVARHTNRYFYTRVD